MENEKVKYNLFIHLHVHMEEKSRHQNKKRIYGIVIWILAWFTIGYIVQFQNLAENKNGIENIRKNWELTNPALNYEYGINIMNNAEINLEKPLQEYIQKKEYDNMVTHVSVYYRDLNNGNWFGINEKEMFSPASLMKLPLLLVYLKKIEKDPKVRDQKLIYIKDPNESDYTQNIIPQKRLIDNQTYTIKELLEDMIMYSDNKASLLLEKNIQLEDYKKAFTDNNMIFPDLIDGRFDNNLKVIDYAKFFRVLFNGSYVNKELSNYALLLLTKVDFKQWLVAGVEDETIVAHKFGERDIIQNGWEQKQLHDCGIIYYPNHPYILCIMTRGETFEILENIVKSISQDIYGATKKEYTKK